MTQQIFNFSQIINPGDVIVLGDIHGCFNLYESFLDHVRNSGATVILLGDLIDRGPNDMAVLDRTQELLVDPESWGLQAFYALRGNHEKMFLDAVDGYGARLWAQNGGDYQNLESLTIHAGWISQLPIYMTIGDTVFIHGGVYPGEDPSVTIADGGTNQLVWMRDPFLNKGPAFFEWTHKLKQVVFGHSPLTAPMPYRILDGVCVDTGAYHTGVLTSYNVTRDTFWQYEVDND